MEEILASIRRIIADESTSAPPAAPEPAAAEEAISEEDLDRLFAEAGATDDDAGDLDDVLDLTLEEEPEAGAADPMDDFGLVEGLSPEEDDLAFVDPATDVAPEPELAPADPFLTADFEAEEPEVEPDPEPLHPPFDPAAFAAPPRREFDELISPAVNATVHAAFGSLAHTVLASNPRTLEDLVSDMLRPMLKQWLDENLPVMVERMVRAEIERITRRR
jgi:Uncharacterized protein conserved in bacteria